MLLMEESDLLEVDTAMKGGWSFVEMGCGEQCATKTGTSLMPMLHVQS